MNALKIIGAMLGSAVVLLGLAWVTGGSGRKDGGGSSDKAVNQQAAKTQQQAAANPQEQALAKWAEAEKLLQQYHKATAANDTGGTEVTFQSDVKKSESLTSPFEAYLTAMYTYTPAQPQYAVEKHVFKWKNNHWIHDSTFYTEVRNWQRSRVDFEKQGLLTQMRFGGQFSSTTSQRLQEFLQKHGMWD